MNFNVPLIKADLQRWLFAFVLICSSQLIIEESLAAEAELSIANVSAVALKAKYAELNEQLLTNQFQRQLHLISTESFK